MGHFTAQRNAYMRGCPLRSRTWAAASILLLLTPLAAQAQIVGVSISVAPGGCLSFWELMAFTPMGVNVAWNALGTNQSLVSGQPDSSAELGNDLIARPYELGVGGYVSSSCSNALGDTWQVMWAQPQQIALIFVINRADFNIVNGAVTLIGQDGLGMATRPINSSNIITRLDFQPVLWPVVPDLSNSTVLAQQNLVSDTWVRFVEVRCQVAGHYVEMRELMVFDDTGSNVAAGKATRASLSSSGTSASVVDFIVTTGATGPTQVSTNNFFSTGPASIAQPNATGWSVDLGGSYNVVNVVVFCWEEHLEDMAYNRFSFQNARGEELLSWSAPMQPEAIMTFSVVLPSGTPTPSQSASPSASLSAGASPSATQTSTSTCTSTLTPLSTRSLTRSARPTASSTPSSTRTGTSSVTPSLSLGTTPSSTVTITPTRTRTRSLAPTRTGTRSISSTRTPSSTASSPYPSTPTPSASLSIGATPSVSPLPTEPFSVAVALLIDLRAADYDPTTGLWDNRATPDPVVSYANGDFAADASSSSSWPTLATVGPLRSLAVVFNASTTGAAQYLYASPVYPLFSPLYGGPTLSSWSIEAWVMHTGWMTTYTDNSVPSCILPDTGPQRGIDRTGNDFAGYPVLLPAADPTLCWGLCNQTADCVAWAYAIPGCDTYASPMCWLKGFAGTTTSRPCRISGAQAHSTCPTSNFVSPLFQWGNGGTQMGVGNDHAVGAFNTPGARLAYGPPGQGASTVAVPGSGYMLTPWVFHHVVLTYSVAVPDIGAAGRAVTLFVDGAMSSIEVGPGIAVDRGPNIVIGSWLLSGQPPTGGNVAVATLRMHRGPLSAEQVAANFANGAPGFILSPSAPMTPVPTPSVSASSSGSASGSGSPSSTLSMGASSTSSSSWTPSPSVTASSSSRVAVAGTLLAELRAEDFDATIGMWDNRVTPGPLSLANGDFVPESITRDGWPTRALRGPLRTPAVVFNATTLNTPQYLAADATLPLFAGLYGTAGDWTFELWILHTGWYGMTAGFVNGVPGFDIRATSPILQWGPRPSLPCAGGVLGIGFNNIWGAVSHGECDLAFGCGTSMVYVNYTLYPGSGCWPTVGVWHHMVVTYNDRNFIESLYVDGVLNAAKSQYVSIAPSRTIFLGAYFVETPSEYVIVGGSIAVGALRIHSGCLSASQVAYNYGVDAASYIAIPSPTRSPPVTRSLTRSGSRTPSGSSTPSASLSTGASPSYTASSTASISTSRTESPTNSGSAVPSVTNGISVTPAATLTPGLIRWYVNGVASDTYGGFPIVLTPAALQVVAGSTYMPDQQWADSFTVHAAFTINRYVNPETGVLIGCTGDGIVLLAQTSVEGGGALGGPGSALGTEGIPSAVGIRFDTYSNGGVRGTFGLVKAGARPNASVDTNWGAYGSGGENVSVPSLDLSVARTRFQFIPGTQMQWWNGHTFDVLWSYDGSTSPNGTMTTRIQDITGGGAPLTYTYYLDIYDYLCPTQPRGSGCLAYFGATAANGNCRAQHNLLLYTYTDNAPTASTTQTPSAGSTRTPAPSASPPPPTWQEEFVTENPSAGVVVSDGAPPVTATLLLLSSNASNPQRHTLRLSCAAIDPALIRVGPLHPTAHVGDTVNVSLTGLFERGRNQDPLMMGGSSTSVVCDTRLVVSPALLDVTVGLDVLYLPSMWPFFGSAVVHYPFRNATAVFTQATLLNLVLLDATNITLYADNSTWISGGPAFDPNVTVSVGGVPAIVWGVSLNGTQLDFQAPSYADVCGDSTAAATCPTATLSVMNPIGVAVSCPPFCPGTANPPMPLAVAGENGSVIIIPDTGSTPVTLLYGGGITYLQGCDSLGYTDPTLGVCTDVSDPRSRSCAFGGGNACDQCPAGAVCPGGYRAWPLPGFWNVGASSSDVISCSAPSTTRCVGWDPQTQQAGCGAGYRNGSSACTNCDDNYYPDVRGTCSLCPVSTSMLDAVGSGVVFLLTLLAAALLAIGFSWLVIRSEGHFALVQSWRLIRGLLLYIFLLFQVQVQLAAGTQGPGLPSALRLLYQRLSLFAFQGLSVHPACLHSSPLMVSIAHLAVLALIWIVYLVVLRTYLRVHRGDQNDSSYSNSSGSIDINGSRRNNDAGTITHDNPIGGAAVVALKDCTDSTTADSATSATAGTSVRRVPQHKYSSLLSSQLPAASRSSATGDTTKSPPPSANVQLSRNSSIISCLPKSTWLEYVTSLAFVLQCLCLLLMVTYSASTYSVLEAITCDTQQVTALQYSTMCSDGTALAAAGITMPPPLDPARVNSVSLTAQFVAEQQTLTVKVLRSNPAVVCYEGEHRALAVLAWPLLLLFVFGFPLLTAFMVRGAVVAARQFAVEAARRRSGAMDFAHDAHMLDDSIAVYARSHPFAHAASFTDSFFRPSQWWFWHVEYCLLVVLPGLAIIEGGSGSSSIVVDIVRFVLVAVLCALLAFAYYAYQPYAKGMGWMQPAKYVTLLILAVLAALTFVGSITTKLSERPEVIAGTMTLSQAASLYGLDAIVLYSAESALAYITLFLSGALYLIVVVGYFRSLLADVRARRRHTLVARRPLASVVDEVPSPYSDGGGSGSSGGTSPWRGLSAASSSSAAATGSPSPSAKRERS